MLDNCEHLLDACADLALAVLTGCPGVRLLATSRERLDLPGEVVVSVGGLDARSATELFTSAAVAAYPGFTGAADTVDRICSKLDRLPLALELTAARTSTVSLDELAASLDDPRTALRGQRRSADPRHRSLADVIAWSVDLLDDVERRTLVALSVFVGSFGTAAAEAVVGGPAAAKAVDGLVRRSLLSRVPDVAGESRVRMLETVRQFASRLDPPTRLAATGRHLRYHLHLADAAARGVRTADSPSWMARLRACSNDLRAAVREAFASDPAVAARMVADVSWPWFLDGRLTELRAWTEQALTGNVSDPTLRARLCFGRADAAIAHGDLDAASQAASDQLRAARAGGNTELAGHGHQILGMVAWARGDHPSADDHHQAAIRQLRRCDEKWSLALHGRSSRRVRGRARRRGGLTVQWW